MTYAVAAYVLAGVIWVLYLFSIRSREARAKQRRLDGPR